MRAKNGNRKYSDSESNNRSRSREKKEAIIDKSFMGNGNQVEGKLYISDIPLNIPQSTITEEFAKFGRIIDFSFRKKKNDASPHYYGYITLSGKDEALNAMETIPKNLNWTVLPFGKELKEKNNREKNINKNLNINSFLNKNINTQEDNLSSNYKNINLNNNLNINLNNNVKIREIWVTNLSLSTEEPCLYKEFFIYGEISKIELKTFWDKKNAFIKYRLVESAEKAFEKENKKYFNGNIIIICFSNEKQRKDILGNEIGYELNENNCKLIVVCLNKYKETMSEKSILNIFEKYGGVKNIAIKNISDRNHIFIEYYKPENAKKAIIEINNEYNVEIRKQLGDENCEIDFFFKNKFNEINPFLNLEKNNYNMNNMIMNMNLVKNNQPNNNLNVINPTLIYQLLQTNLLKNQFNINQLNNNFYNKSPINQIQYKNINNNNYNIKKNNNNQFNNINLNNPLINLFNKNSFQLPNNHCCFVGEPLFPNTPIVPGVQGIQGVQGALCPKNNQNLQSPNQNSLLSFKNFPLLNIPINTNNNNLKTKNDLTTNINNTTFNNHFNTNNNSIKESNNVKDLLNKILLEKNNKKANNNSDSDISSVNSNLSTQEINFEKEYSLEEENLKEIWNGFLTKNKKERVNIDIFKIRGNIDDNYFKGFILNICNRIKYEEVLKKHLLGIVAISPQNITQKDIFDQYINYFTERQRCGVINITENKYTLYITPPCEFSKKFYINPKKHLLGLLVDCTVEPNLYVDMNNLTLPPPVISLTEKRRIMNNKKNESKIDNKKHNDNIKKNDNNSNELISKLKEQIKQLDDNKVMNINDLLKQNSNIKGIIDKLTKKANDKC